MSCTSDGVSFWKLRCTACAIGPNAEPRSDEWPVFRYDSRSSALQVPMPDGSVKQGDASASASAGAGAPATVTR